MVWTSRGTKIQTCNFRSYPLVCSTLPTGAQPMPDDKLTVVEARTVLGLMTDDELGAALGVAGPTVARWRGKGEGPPYVRFKQAVLYRTADVQQWLIEHTHDAVSGELLIQPSLLPPPAPSSAP